MRENKSTLYWLVLEQSETRRDERREWNTYSVMKNFSIATLCGKMALFFVLLFSPNIFQSMEREKRRYELRRLSTPHFNDGAFTAESRPRRSVSKCASGFRNCAVFTKRAHTCPRVKYSSWKERANHSLGTYTHTRVHKLHTQSQRGLHI